LIESTIVPQWNVLLAEDESDRWLRLLDQMATACISGCFGRSKQTANGFGRGAYYAAEKFSRDKGFHAIELWIVNVRKELPGY